MEKESAATQTGLFAHTWCSCFLKSQKGKEKKNVQILAL